MEKKLFNLATMALTVLLITNGQAMAKITGSGHDFKGSNWNSSKEICVVCHTPHSATSTIAPLWNHALTTTNFSKYTSPTLDATIGAPSDSSKACLSCHDGTVALGSFGGKTGSKKIEDYYNLGTKLDDDHPVSFTYDTSLATKDGGLNDPSSKTVSSLGGKTIKDGMLIGGKVECGTCHDVHSGRGDSNTGGYLLVVNNSGSALCLTCHNK